MGSEGIAAARRQPIPHAPWVTAEEDPTTRVWTSAVLRGLKRPPDPSSDVESRERIRAAILTALETAASSCQLRIATPSTSSILAPLRPRRNPFLEPPGAEDPPAPWLLAYAGRTTRRRRSNLPLVAILMALALGLGLAVDHGARAGASATIRSASKLAFAHTTKVLARHHW
jgi:hypothetical protein